MGWDDLTVGERRIAELVAEGLTNRQIGHRLFIERSTVHWHLKNVFKKLGITSRADLAAIVAARANNGNDLDGVEVVHLDKDAGPVEAPRG